MTQTTLTSNNEGLKKDSIKNKNVFLKWKMTFYAFKSEQSIEGISELTFNKFPPLT